MAVNTYDVVLIDVVVSLLQLFDLLNVVGVILFLGERILLFGVNVAEEGTRGGTKWGSGWISTVVVWLCDFAGDFKLITRLVVISSRCLLFELFD